MTFSFLIFNVITIKSDNMLLLVFTVLGLVGSTISYPQGNGENGVGFDLSNILARLSVPFFGLQASEGQNEELGEQEISSGEDDSSGAEASSFAGVGVDANGNLFTNAEAAAAHEEDDSDEGFSLFSFSGSVVQTNGDEVSMDSYAGSRVIEEDGDEASSLSLASLDRDENGITVNTNSYSEATDT